jgi:glutathione S-transferase
MHAVVGPLFNPTITTEIRSFIVSNYKKKLTYVNNVLLAGKTFVVGNFFSIADLYLMIVLTWCPYIGIDLAEFPLASAYCKNMSDLPAVVKATEFMKSDPAQTI